MPPITVNVVLDPLIALITFFLGVLVCDLYHEWRRGRDESNNNGRSEC